jgi:uncharacterized membrane protein YhaH (DUF805 family)
MNYFLQGLKNYAKFSGRARRSEFWYFMLFSTIISLILNIIGIATGLTFLSYIYSLAIFVPTLAVWARRMHDVNKSGWYMLIPIYDLVLACTEGTQGENNFGADPKK